MKRFECEFEAEVLTAVVQSIWPHGANDELQVHVRSCEICSDAAAVAVSLVELRETDRSVPIPGSGLVWWRAQLRMKREAASAAERPMLAAQGIAFVCAAAVLVSLVIFSLAGTKWGLFVSSAIALLARHELLLTAMAILVLGAPVAVYLALRKE